MVLKKNKKDLCEEFKHQQIIIFENNIVNNGIVRREIKKVITVILL